MSSDEWRTFLTGIFHRYRENFCPRGGFTSADVAMRYIKGMEVPAFWKSSPLCHRNGALLMSDGSNPEPQHRQMQRPARPRIGNMTMTSVQAWPHCLPVSELLSQDPG